MEALQFGQRSFRCKLLRVRSTDQQHEYHPELMRDAESRARLLAPDLLNQSPHLGGVPQVVYMHIKCEKHCPD